MTWRVVVLREIGYQRSVVIEADDEEEAKAKALRLAPNLVFDIRYPTDHSILRADKTDEKPDPICSLDPLAPKPPLDNIPPDVVE